VAPSARSRAEAQVARKLKRRDTRGVGMYDGHRFESYHVHSSLRSFGFHHS
jgi:hypothetical protein